MGRLVLQNAGKTYHDLNVVQDINLDIEDGEFCGDSRPIRQW
jgi:multiple sugar transport system ATP-binding protein